MKREPRPPSQSEGAIDAASAQVLEQLWHGETDEAVTLAIDHLNTYSSEAQRVIIAESRRRGLETESPGRSDAAPETREPLGPSAKWRAASDESLRIALENMAQPQTGVVRSQRYSADEQRLILSEVRRRIIESPEKVKLLMPRRAQVFGPDEENTRAYEAVAFTGELRVLKDKSLLRKAILTGELSRGLKARVYRFESASASYDSKQAWTTVEDVAGAAGLGTLYRPLWTHTVKGALWGFFVATVIKGIDTSVFLYWVSPALGAWWLAVCASLLLSTKLPFAPLAVLIWMWFSAGIKANLFITAMAVQLIGAALGVPAGMIIGTLVGYFRRADLARAPDASAEGRRPWIRGVVWPLAWLVLAVPAYILFNRWAWDRLSAAGP